MKTIVRNWKNIFIGLLIVINVLVVFRLYQVRSNRMDFRRDRSKMRGDFIAKKLDLDEDQKASFIALKKEHFAESKALRDEQMKLRKEMIDNVGNDSFDIDSHVQKLALIQQDLDRNAYLHFKELRSMCRPSQLENFDKFMGKMMMHMAEGGPRKMKYKEKF